MRKMTVLRVAVVIFLGLHGHAAGMSILSGPHNLSPSGPGKIKSTVKKPVCEFCHTPHHAERSKTGPAWNRELSEVVYTTYQSSSLKATVGQPNGASKLCLSCHDGTIALGMTLNGQSVPSLAKMPPGETNLGIDISYDHPVSFLYDNALATRNGQLAYPSSLAKSVKLDKFGQLQCTSCHDAHDDAYGKFLVMDNTSSSLCVTCHNMTGWSAAPHRLSGAKWNGVGTNPWFHTPYRTVAANGCENCHKPHKAGGKERLLNYSVEEDNCYPCHNGNVASTNIQKEFRKPFTHPVESSHGIHQPTENPLWAPRHVTCADCHNPHAANSTQAVPPRASGMLAQLQGITLSGTPLNPLTNEYELCYRCHADNPGTLAPVVVRYTFETNLRQLFQSSNASYHPVEAPGKNTHVPSLLVPYTTSSIIYCTSCHNNDSGPGAGGTGPNGPHGSNWAPLLERELTTSDLTAESLQAYALCYKCHSRSSILSNQSFPMHSLHIVNLRTPCTACHDSHGVQTSAHLINFDKSIVFPGANGLVQYQSLGRNSGSCSLKCHNKVHNRTPYPGVAGGTRK